LATQKLKFYIATILNPKNDKACDYFKHGLLVSELEGKCWRIKDLLALDMGMKIYGRKMTVSNTHDFGQSVILPGFFDMHFHWVQDDVRQMPKDSLLEWLEKYTFPTEMKFSDKKYAAARASDFFRTLTAQGTIGGACYSSIHEHAIKAAMKEVKGHFVVGNVVMNMNSPEALTQGEDESIELTRRLISKYGKRYCFTPRFAITTTPRVMKEGSKLADKAGCFKQTHLSETPQEIAFVLSLYREIPGFEKVKSYTDIYQKSGMLGKRSLMGHGIHLSQTELATLKRTQTSLIHCPTRNAPINQHGLGSGLFDFRNVEKARVRWALGSDIGGGPFLSMFDVMRSFVDQNKRKKRSDATYVKALYRSTLAGAKILGVEKVSGNLTKGKELSFIVVSLPSQNPPSDPETLLKKLIDPHKRSRQDYAKLVKAVFLNGKKISG
jgi:guanine deaminase